jgi:8-oxo-dGTP pyrophosphatase MutT (NUDIX family)
MVRIVGCFLEYNGKFVVLLRRPEKPDGDTWGLPAGKVEAGETDQAAALRELREETGYEASLAELHYVREDVFNFDPKPVVFVVYKIVLDRPHAVVLEEKAHASHKWVTPNEGYELPLIPGLRLVLRLVGYIR